MSQSSQLCLAFPPSIQTEQKDVRSHEVLTKILAEKRVRKVVATPYNSDIRAGKNTYVYDAHTYHTKVPPGGIAQLIEYYMKPGDLILDPFCGSGMTGVAAAPLGRGVLLSDISPAAVFIARHLNSPIDSRRYMMAVREVLADAQELEARLYNTDCRSCGNRVPMLY